MTIKNTQELNMMELKVWLLRSGYTQSKIAKDLCITRSCVCRTINGNEKNSRVMQWLKDHYCPDNLIEGLSKSENRADR
jgi:DNA-binding transcriptional regulator LsrR (DeoR family)